GMRVYNSAGEFIKNLAPGTDPQGLSHSFLWDGTNYLNQPCADGIYILYYLQPRQVSETKVLLLR
ncbi:MAG TPA: FlgD immunoglobulin-like domain containing protein, partial [bacterium]|nr:FlgD immunoglobulin-like domain containing protein [bacterium]